MYSSLICYEGKKLNSNSIQTSDDHLGSISQVSDDPWGSSSQVLTVDLVTYIVSALISVTIAKLIRVQSCVIKIILIIIIITLTIYIAP